MSIKNPKIQILLYSDYSIMVEITKAIIIYNSIDSIQFMKNTYKHFYH